MRSGAAERLTLDLENGRSVSALWLRPTDARACLVLAHGAGAGMTHPSLEAIAAELGERGIATLRFQFPYMEEGSRRPDPPGLAQMTVRAAVAAAGRLGSDLPLVAGGRSFGGRMTSQAQAAEPLPGVRGLVFLSFPLHPAGRAASERGDHLYKVAVPMLFLQGTRDALAHLPLLQGLCERLGDRATLKLLPEADHSMHVPARSGRTDDQVRDEMLTALVDWIDAMGPLKMTAP